MKRIFVKKNGDYGKKIKLSTTDVVISVLVISILILGVKEIYDKIQYEKTATVVGEIIYNESFENGGADIKVGSKFYIQLLPLGQENGALFTYAFTKNSASAWKKVKSPVTGTPVSKSNAATLETAGKFWSRCLSRACLSTVKNCACLVLRLTT